MPPCLGSKTRSETLVSRRASIVPSIRSDLGASFCFDGNGLDGSNSEPVYATSFSWAVLLSRHLPASYFERVRTTESRAGPIGRTCTRTRTRQVRGHVLNRYHDGVAYSKSVLPPE